MPDADKLMAHNSEEAGKTTCRSMWWSMFAPSARPFESVVGH